jgi:hypothetical protein
MLARDFEIMDTNSCNGLCIFVVGSVRIINFDTIYRFFVGLNLSVVTLVHGKCNLRLKKSICNVLVIIYSIQQLLRSLQIILLTLFCFEKN